MQYTPDFILPNGVIVETKGVFGLDDRQKHLWLMRCHPDLDIRFVFTCSKSPLRQGAKATYADWCLRHGFQFADEAIPQAWIDEPAAKCAMKKRSDPRPTSSSEAASLETHLR